MSGIRESRADAVRAAASVRRLRKQVAARRLRDVLANNVRLDSIAKIIDGCGAAYVCHCAECSRARHA